MLLEWQIRHRFRACSWKWRMVSNSTSCTSAFAASNAPALGARAERGSLCCVSPVAMRIERLAEPRQPHEGKNLGATPDDHEPTKTPYVVAVLGRSGSGKTTLLERLIPEIARHGLEIGAVKHTSHGFTADRPGKDSYRFYEAGATVVALASREHLAFFHRRTEAPTDEGVPLAEILASLPRSLDVVLVEGFSWEALPRYVIVPGSEKPLEKHLERGEVLRIIEVPVPEAGSPPRLDDALIASLVEEIVAATKATRS